MYYKITFSVKIKLDNFIDTTTKYTAIVRSMNKNILASKLIDSLHKRIKIAPENGNVDISNIVILSVEELSDDIIIL